MVPSRAPLVVLALVGAQPALADGGEWMVLAEPTFGVYRGTAGGETATEPGAGGNAAAWLGLTDVAWLFATAGGAVVLGDGPTIGEALGGLALALDVLRTVPFLEVGLGAGLVGGELVPALRVGVGADYLVTPHFTLGGVARYRPAFGRGEEDWWTLSLRIGWRSY